MFRRYFAAAACLIAACSCADRTPESPLQKKVDAYAVYQIGSPYMDGLTDNGKEVLNLFRMAADEVDHIYWQQSFGDKSVFEALPEGPERSYAMINYGPWDRLDNNAPFIAGYG